MGIDWSDGKAPAGRGIDDVEQDKLAAAGAGPGDTFGAAVAINGNVLVAGAPSQAGDPEAGLAYVHRFDAGSSTWPLDGVLDPAAGAAYDGFGAAVAVADRLARQEQFKGKTIVVILPDAAERYLTGPLFEGLFKDVESAQAS